MTNLNYIVLQGNLTRDTETRFSQAGAPIVNFSIAVNSGFGDKEEVSFVDCVAFGKQGEAIAKFFKKGKQIIVEGRLRQDRWDDKQTGQKRAKLIVIVNSFHFVGSKEVSSEVTPEETPAVNALAVPAVTTGDGKLF